MSNPSTPTGSPTTIDGVIARSQAILNHALVEGERIGYFAALYLRVTQSVKRALTIGTIFKDNARMERFDVIFANRFLTAWDAFSSGGDPSGPWRVAFEQLARNDLMIMQHLGLAMNAHINYDLGIAAEQLMRERGEPLAALHEDFNMINTVLARLTGIVQVQLAEVSATFGGLEGRDPLLENHLFGLVLDGLRNGAWYLANQLEGKSAIDRALVEAERSVITVAAAEIVLHPPGFGEFVQKVVREEQANGVPFNMMVLAE